MKTKTTKPKVWTRPCKISHEEFVAGIRKAEDGPFFTLEELKQKMTDWKKENGYL